MLEEEEKASIVWEGKTQHATCPDQKGNTVEWGDDRLWDFNKFNILTQTKIVPTILMRPITHSSSV